MCVIRKSTWSVSVRTDIEYYWLFEWRTLISQSFLTGNLLWTRDKLVKRLRNNHIYCMTWDKLRFISPALLFGEMKSFVLHEPTDFESQYWFWVPRWLYHEGRTGSVVTVPLYLCLFSLLLGYKVKPVWMRENFPIVNDPCDGVTNTCTYN